MKQAPNKFEKNWVGVVSAKSGSVKVRLTTLAKTKGKSGNYDQTKNFPNDEETMDIRLADLPKTVQKIIRPEMPPTRFRVRLNSDGDNIEAVGPVTGMFKAKLVGLGPKDKNGNYKLIHKVFNQGQESENSHDEFVALYEITEGPFKGQEPSAYYLHYKFEEVPEGEDDEGLTRFNCSDSPRATQFHRLLEWTALHGSDGVSIVDEDIHWPDDGIILDVLEERALENDVPVNLIFDNGYISKVQPVDDYGSDADNDDVTDEDIDDEFPEEEVTEVKKQPAKMVKEEVKATVPAKSKKTAQVTDEAKPKSKAKKVVADDDDDL